MWKTCNMKPRILSATPLLLLRGKPQWSLFPGAKTPRWYPILLWAQNAGIILKKKNDFFLSPLGQLIARHDPNLEEDGIWWLIHYHLACSESPAWFYSFYFNRFDLDEFSREQFETQVRAHWDDTHEKPMTDSVFHKLIFLPIKQVFEGTRLGDEFGFWQTNEDGDYFRTAFCTVPVPKAILAYALIEWCCQNERQSVHLEKLLEPGGVGRIFRTVLTGQDMGTSFWPSLLKNSRVSAIATGVSFSGI